MRFGSLFSGVGGFDLGLEQAGWECAWQVEIDPFCRKVLEKHWPEVPKYEDIRDLPELEPVDLIAGGFPCQDLSSAGKMAGIHGRRSGIHREFVACVGRLSPAWVLVENVYQTWRRWVPKLRGDLWDLGYSSLPIRVRAAELGAPHIRSRGFVLAHPDGQRLRELRGGWRWPDGKGEAVPFVPWNQEPGVPRVDDGVSRRVDRLRSVGNAVAVPVARWIGEQLLEAAGPGDE